MRKKNKESGKLSVLWTPSGRSDALQCRCDIFVWKFTPPPNYTVSVARRNMNLRRWPQSGGGRDAGFGGEADLAQRLLLDQLCRLRGKYGTRRVGGKNLVLKKLEGKQFHRKYLKNGTARQLLCVSFEANVSLRKFKQHPKIDKTAYFDFIQPRNWQDFIWIWGTKNIYSRFVNQTGSWCEHQKEFNNKSIQQQISSVA